MYAAILLSGDGRRMLMPEIELRPAVKWFAQLMETKLRARDYRGGWSGCSIDNLAGQMGEEIEELAEAIGCGRKKCIIEEAVDVANYCMMLADVAQAMVEVQGDG